MKHMRPVICLLAHYSTAVWLVFTAYVLMRRYGLAVVPLGFEVGLLSLWFVTGVSQFLHTRLLCARCAARTPLNGSAMAARRWLALHLFHLTLKILLTALVVAAVWLVLGLDWVVVWFLALSILDMRHRLVRLWCPRCRDGDGVGMWSHHRVPVEPGGR